MRSLSGITVHFAQTSYEEDYEVLALYPPKFRLWYSSSSTLSLCGYSNADFAGCQLDHKSTSGTYQFLGSSWYPGPLTSSLV